MEILFVCTGNTCRSPMAAALFLELCRRESLRHVEVRSAGTDAVPGQSTHALACAALKAQGIPVEPARSRPLTRSLAEAAEVIVAMTGAQQKQIGRSYPAAVGKVQTLKSICGDFSDVPDPYGGPLSEYLACLAAMRPALERLIAWMIDQRSANDNEQRSLP